MLTDAEEKEIPKIMLRILRVNDKLFDFWKHTENADHDNILLAREFLSQAVAHLALVGGQHEMDN